MRLEYKYIYFVKIEEKGKTSVWSCRNNKSGAELGRIGWYGPWQQYCFGPIAGTIFNVGCLDDIKDFIGQLKNGG